MKFDTHESDLYVLPETSREVNSLQSYCKTKKLSYSWQYSNVAGQGWEGKQFLEIPFCKHLKEDIIDYLKTTEQPHH